MEPQNDHIYALEVQYPYSNFILNGSKTIESREYSLPGALLNQSILLLESGQGSEGISSLPDVISPDIARSGNLHVIGIVTFCNCFQYTSEQQWADDRSQHLVPIDSKYNWSELYTDGIKRKFGWVIGNVTKYDSPKQVSHTIARIYRSFFDCGLKITYE